MNTYKVTWVIEVDAFSASEAAAIALATQRNPESVATCFSVLNTDTGRTFEIDLDEKVSTDE